MRIARQTVACVVAGLAWGHALAQTAEPPLRLYLDTRPGLRLGHPSGLPEREPRIGVEFKLAPTPVHGVAKGTLLRTKLSEGTHLSLRVRRHGVAVVLRSEF